MNDSTENFLHSRLKTEEPIIIATCNANAEKNIWRINCILRICINMSTVLQCHSGLLISMPDCGTRGPRIEPVLQAICFSRNSLRYAALGIAAYLLHCVGRLSLLSSVGQYEYQPYG